MNYNIFTDGSCLDHGKEYARGGWAFIVTDDSNKVIKESYGKLRIGKQTNNRAELEAMLQALLWIDLQDNKDFYTIYADSETVVHGINGEASRNANRDIWRQVEIICSKNIGKFTVKSIKAHNDKSEDIKHSINCQADKLAKKGANSLLIAPIEIDL